MSQSLPKVGRGWMARCCRKIGSLRGHEDAIADKKSAPYADDCEDFAYALDLLLFH